MVNQYKIINTKRRFLMATSFIFVEGTFVLSKITTTMVTMPLFVDFANSKYAK